MSVRAYKVKELSSEPTFNIWQDNQDIINWILDNCQSSSGGSDCPNLYIDKEQLETMRKELVDTVDLKTLDEFIDRLRTDMEEDDGADYISY